MSSAKSAFGSTASSSARRLGPSVVLYEDFERILKPIPPLDPRPEVGAQTAVRMFPDKTIVKVRYTPSAAWDDIHFTTDRYDFYFENKREQITENGSKKVTFIPTRLTLSEVTKDSSGNPTIGKTLLQVHHNNTSEAADQIAKMARKAVNEALSRNDIDKAAQRILREAPGIIASFTSSPSP